MNKILQLTHIARPGVLAQKYLSILTKTVKHLTLLSSKEAQKVLSHNHHIIAAITQRRQLQRNNIEPVVEIFTKLAKINRFRQRSRRSRQQLGDKRIALMATDRRELALLNNPQQLRLQRQRQSSYLIEKQRALSRCRHQSLMIRRGAGKGTLLMTKQL